MLAGLCFTEHSGAVCGVALTELEAACRVRLTLIKAHERSLAFIQSMYIFTLEQSKAAYRADFALYVAPVVCLSTYLMVAGPQDHQVQLFAITLVGLAAWTFIEYALHRFVLHGLHPFRRWHAAHHERPRALICTPTLLSALLICALVFLPALLLGGAWRACALTIGLLIGYLVYAITHHATHHWRANSAWLLQRKHWHALHHHIGQPGHYGVTSAFWDHVFGSAGDDAASSRS